MDATVNELAKLSGIPRTTIYEWITAGKIKQKTGKDGKQYLDKVEFLKSIPTAIAFFNQKGGVGKTTSAVLFADYFDKRGEKTLIIDFDQQGNLSQTFFDYDDIQESLTIYEFLENHTPLKKIVKKYNDNIDVIPAHIRLAKKEAIDTSLLLNYRKEFFSLFKDYQVILIDCPPALNTFSRLAIMISHYVVIPLNEEPYCYQGLADAVGTITTMQELSPNFINFIAYSSRHTGHRSIIKDQTETEYKSQLQDRYIEDPTVPVFNAIVERTVSRQNIFDMYPKDKKTKSIWALLEAIHKKIYEDR